MFPGLGVGNATLFPRIYITGGFDFARAQCVAPVGGDIQLLEHLPNLLPDPPVGLVG